MILGQKNIRYLLFGLVLIFTTLYFFILKLNIVSIEELSKIQFFSITLSLIGWLLGIVLVEKINRIWLLYQVIGIGLIIFLILSVFILKVEDIFFWNAKKNEYQGFFDFCIFLYGWNYALAFPYLLLLMFECAILYQSTKNKNKD